MKHPALAAALLACAGSAAAQSSVTLYGVADVYAESTRISGRGSLARLGSGGLTASRWGLRAIEDLGGGLKATAVLESGVALDTGTSLQGGRLFGRQAYVSLTSSSLGEVRLGRQYSPLHYSLLFSDVDAFAVFSPIFAMYLSNGEQSRQDNQVSYWTPNLSGFSGMVAVAAGERAAVAPGAATPWIPAAGTMKRNVGGMLRYQAGPIDVNVGYVQGGQALAAGDADQRAFNVGAIYKFSAFNLGGNYWDYRNELPSGATPKVRGASIGVKVPAGAAWSFVAQVGRVEDDGREYTTGAAKAEGRNTYVNLGANYALSKRTDVYLRYARIDDKNGGYNGRATTALFGVFGPGNTLPAGGSASTVALGLRHLF